MRADDLIATMDSFVGIAENPPGSNRTPIGAEFGWNGVPWCAETVSVACARNGFPLHEAAVINIERRAKDGWNGMSWSNVAVRGSAVCFDFGGRGNPANMHTGIVYEVLPAGQFRTIEGNYRDRVDRWLRDLKFVRGFAVFPFDSPIPIPQPIPPQEDDVAKVRLFTADRTLDAGGPAELIEGTVYVVASPPATDSARPIKVLDPGFLHVYMDVYGKDVEPVHPGGTRAPYYDPGSPQFGGYDAPVERVDADFLQRFVHPPA